MFSLLTMLLIQPVHADRYAFDDSSGTVSFDMVATLHEIHGLVQNFSGELHTDLGRENPASLSIQASSMTTQLGIRDSRMHGYVLAIESFPTVEIQVHTLGGDVEALASGQGAGTIALKGRMTVRSSTREVSIPAFFRFRDDGTLVLRGEYGLDWTDFNLPDASIAISTLQPRINVAFEVVARKTN
jgi:polyisoprenoid-binding protein YceI